jgi:Rab GDP dissociation inhibitor
MEEEYDYIVLGTGLAECVLSEVLSRKGYKVIQVDRNTSYGSDIRTLKYTEMEDRFGNGTMDLELQKLDKHFSTDLMPKFLLADGYMKRLLLKYDLSELISFIQILGSFILKKTRYELYLLTKRSPSRQTS